MYYPRSRSIEAIIVVRFMMEVVLCIMAMTMEIMTPRIVIGDVTVIPRSLLFVIHLFESGVGQYGCRM